MQITHEQAQTLIQFAADRPLDSAERTNLESHLEGCSLCRNYASDLEKLGGALRASMRKRWEVAPPPLSNAILNSRKPALKFQRLLPLAAAPLTVAFVILLAVFFTRWQITTGGSTSTPLPTPTAITAPAPSAGLTSADELTLDCPREIYEVQAGDSLDSIAQKFSISREIIIRANGLTSERIVPSALLVIPQCGPTPSQFPISTLTRTVTPAFLTTSHTP
ncbi:MAG: LysM peptidoglycan-binding domain-containing protein [Chloroflexota bacterium]